MKNQVDNLIHETRFIDVKPKMVKVWVASGNPQKINAVKTIIQERAEVVYYAVPSHIDQPIGEETLHCAYRRIQDLIRLNETGPEDIIVALENGLEIIDSPDSATKWALDKA